MRQQRSFWSWRPCQHENGKEHRLFRTTYDLNRTSMDEKMWSNASSDYLPRLRSNIKPRKRSRSFLYGPGEVLPRRSCLLQGQNWRFRRQNWAQEERLRTSHRDPRRTTERTGGKEFIMTTKTIHGNSQFQKPSSLRWTWESPGGGYRNEIDHIIVNKRFCLTDVAVVPKFYTGSDHRLLRGRFSFTRREEKAAKFRERNPRTIVNWDLFATLAGFWKDSAIENVDEKFRLVEQFHDCTKKAESFKTTNICLSLETLELIRQRGAARAAGNQELTSELAWLCREAIRENLKERRAEVLAEAAEAGKKNPYARRYFASRKTRMSALRNPKGTIIASRRGMEKNIYDFYSDLFDSHIPLASSPSERRWTCYSRGSPVQSTTCYHVGKKSYGTRSQKIKIRTPEEPSSSAHQDPGEALHTLPVGMQGF
ncbi:hypothetical protein RB195_022709 [Necator americanus]|uniref:Endonuclease/exonuclease/phosphatase domain-containing protein n=1 Tax=Necator americanus TaxID=51031 RepID=A0ABR1EIW4_NECAM